jgi:hypothetical protein
MFVNNSISLGFEVWIPATWLGSEIVHCVASFYYWQECLDFKDYCSSRGLTCYIRTLNPSKKDYRTEMRSP